MSDPATATDLQLLARYTHDHAEDAFAELVRRHLNLVYSAALRQVRSPQLAEEVAQSAFTDLARNAHRLAPDTVLSAWLYQVTRRTAIDLVRREARRQLREQIAIEMNATNATETDWTHIQPLLDEAMHALDETDRTAVLLRYFENKSLRDVGTTLGTSDDTAQKRVSRAVERLREFFAQRDVTIGAGGLVVIISANAVQTAPAALAATISTAAALTGTTLATTTTATVKIIAMTTFQKALVTATIAILAGAGLYQAHQAATLRSQVQTLQQAQAPLTERLTQLKTEHERLSNQLVQARDAQALSKAQLNELLKLRGKSGVAQADSIELARLKSTLAEQTGKTPDYMTNAMAVGMRMAEKIKTKAAQAQVALMKTTLNLTDDQVQAITDILQKHIKRRTEMTLELLSGKNTPEQRQALFAEDGHQDDEIKALLTSEQLAAYPQYQQAEKTEAADKSAKTEAARITEDFGLSPEKQEQIRAAFYQMNLAPSAGGPEPEAIAAAKKSGDLADYSSLSLELSKTQLESKSKILENILSPEQMAAYRKEQLNQINMFGAMMKMFPTQKSAGVPKLIFYA